MNKQLKYKIIAATPLFCLILFLILGFADDFGFSSKPLWHPGWIVFLTIPLVHIFTSRAKFTIGRKPKDYID